MTDSISKRAMCQQWNRRFTKTGSKRCYQCNLFYRSLVIIHRSTIT